MIALEAGSADDSHAYRPPVIAPPKTTIMSLLGALQGATQQSVRDVGLVRPLSSSVDFREVALPLGACRASALAALSNIFDSFYGVDEDGQAECAGQPAHVAHSDDDADHPGRGTKPSRSAVPSTMLGPALDAVADWILKPPAPIATEDGAQDDIETDASTNQQSQSNASAASEGHREGSGRAPQGRGLVGVVLSAIFGIGGRLLSGDVAGAARGAGLGGEEEEEDGEGERDPDGSPIDSCCGCVLHVFVSSPQDLPPGAHDSVGTSDALDPAWVHSRAALFAAKSLCVHVWAVCSFEGHPVGLSALAPLARLTGGAMHHHVLGAYPKDERARLADALTRTLTQQLACRAVMKMRTSGAIQVAGDATGALCPDPDLPQVSRIAACSPDAAFGFQFSYRSEWAAVAPDTRGDCVVLQVAFSYETLVESRQVIDYYLDDDAYAHDDDDDEGAQSGSARGLDPYFDSAVDLLDLRQEVSAVKGAALREREREQDARSARRSHARRRPPRDVWARLTTAPHAVVSRGSSEAAHPCNEWLDSCGYDRSKSLVAVRRLRVITVMVDTVSSVLQVIQAADPSTVALLIAREAIAEDEARGATANSGSAGQECVHAWTVALLAAAVTAISREEQKSLPKLDREGKLTLLRSVADDPPLLALVRVLCGASDVLRKIAPSATASGAGREAALAADAFELFDSRRQLYDADERAQMRSLLMLLDSFTCQKIFYPELMAVHLESYTGSDSPPPATLSVMHSDTWQLPLKREAMTASGAPLFVLDAGIDIILYRALGAPAPPAPSVSASNSAISNTNNSNSNSSSSSSSRSESRPAPPRAVSAGPDAPPAGASVHRFASRGRGLGGGMNSLNITPQLDTPMFAKPTATPAAVADNAHEQEGEGEGEGAAAGPSDDMKTVTSDRELLDVVGTLVRDSAWLPAAMHERLTLSPAAMLPRLHSAGAGTSSSEVFTARLVENHSVYAPSGSTGRRGAKGRQTATCGPPSGGGGGGGPQGGGRYPAGTGIGGTSTGAGAGAGVDGSSASTSQGARIGLSQFISSAVDEAIAFC